MRVMNYENRSLVKQVLYKKSVRICTLFLVLLLKSHNRQILLDFRRCQNVSFTSSDIESKSLYVNDI